MELKKGLGRGPFNDSQAERLSNVLSELDVDQLNWLSGYFSGISQSTSIASGTVTNQEVVSAPSATEVKPQNITILYGTHTGHSEALSADLAAKAKALGIQASVSDMASFKTRDLKKVETLAIIVSTDGLGEPPVSAEDLYKFLHGKKAPNLSHINYSVLALGDRSYADFCQTGKDFDAVLEKLGATRILDRQDCDVDYDEPAEAWQNAFLNSLTQNSGAASSTGNLQASEQASATTTVYSRKNLFEATILEKINLNGKGSSKETIHIELDLEGSGITYEPGDALGVYGSNSDKLTQAVLAATKLSGDQLVATHKGEQSLLEALTYDYELTPLTKSTLEKYADLTDNQQLKDVLTNTNELPEYLKGRDILDLITEVPFELSAEAFISILRKNTARMYSIASSQDAVENEVHLLVSVVRYNALGRDKEGHCSTTLADRLEVDDKVKVFVDKNTRFRLPTDPEAPIIMVGPGTGVAPFRAFMQQLEVSEKRTPSWLFFGDRNFTTDFLYQTEWHQYLNEGVLTKADVAFSRDQQHKQYVQDRMIENGKELYQWLEKGAHFYVCGDAKRMAKDVDSALKEIIQQQGGLSLEKTEAYIKNLQLSNRYQTDIY
jgi:sulfite reductase (NADPH) flavoprotein alpha-component